MKELKPYLQRNLTTCPLNIFFMNKRGKHGQEQKPATISHFQRRTAQNEKNRGTVIERDDED